MAKARALGADVRVKVASETTYGTAPTSGYMICPIKSTTLGAETPIAVDELLGQGRAAIGAYYQRKNVTGDLVVPVDPREFGLFLKALFGGVSPTQTHSTGTITFSGQPANNSTITLNGTTWTFKTSGATGAQTNIGANLAATLTALASDLNGSADTQVVKCTYTAGSTSLSISYDTVGTGGNTFTIAASATSNGTVSAATLLGGGYQHQWVGGGSPGSLAIEIAHVALATPQYFLNKGAVAGSLAITISGDGSQPVNATIPFIAQNEVLNTSTIDGSAGQYTVDRFSGGRVGVKIDGTQFDYATNLDLNITNSPEAVVTLRPDQLIDGVDLGVCRPSGKVTVKFSDVATMTSALAAAEAQDPVALTYSFSHPKGWSLVFEMPSCLISKPKVTVANTGGVEVDIMWQGEYDSVAGYGVRVTLINDVASYS